MKIRESFKFFKRTDIILVSALILAGVFGLWTYRSYAAEKTAVAEIYYYTELVERVDLHTGEERSIRVPQNENVVLHVYADGSIAFVQSDCSDKVCIHAGKLNMAGQSAACLPNGILLKIVPSEGQNGEDIDITLGYANE